MSIKVNATVFNKRMKKLTKLPKFLMAEALTLTKENTPKASGNARNNTVIKGNKIVSDYAYAGKLDSGYSNQAPQGFTKPTIEQLQKEAETFVRKI